MEQKKLYRSRKNKIFAGVCGGLGEYFKIDPVLIRLVWVLVLVFTGIIPGVLIYIIAIIIMPLAPDNSHHTSHSNNHSGNSDHHKEHKQHEENN